MIQRLTWLVGACLALTLGACATHAPLKQVQSKPSLTALFAYAFRADAEDDGMRSTGAFLSALNEAASSDDRRWQMPTMVAALDALVTRSMPSLGEASADAALAQRTTAAIVGPIERIAREARGPLARGIISRALTTYFERSGDANRAEAWREATGCAREALVIGPVSRRPITGIDAPDPLAPFDARVPPFFPVDGEVLARAVPIAVSGRGCSIPIAGNDESPGVRDVVVDIDVPRHETIGIALRSESPSLLRVGGLIATNQPFCAAIRETIKFALVNSSAGVLRVVARVGSNHDGESLEIDAWASDGTPLRTHVPRIGSAGSARALDAREVDIPTAGNPAETLVGAAAALALGRSDQAEQMVRPFATLPNSPPEMALLYGRAVELAGDLPQAVRAQRARGAYEQVLSAWPWSWEAAIAHAVQSGKRTSKEESGFETLRDLSMLRRSDPLASSRLLDVFDALTSGLQSMFDRARASLESAHSSMGATAFFADALAATAGRIGSSRVTAACDPKRPTTQSTLSCFEALSAAGQHARALDELDRVRRIDGAPTRFLPIELRERISSGSSADRQGARRVFEAMLPSERSLTLFAMLSAEAIDGAAIRGWPSMRDSTNALGPLLRAAGEDPTTEFDGIAERLAASGDAGPTALTVATEVLAHVERYSLANTGLLSWMLFDVRRVNGTKAVEENANAESPDIWGHSTSTTLRRRILKRDGRILDPEPTPHASQSNAELSELEPGDVIEAIYEGWATPTDVGGDLTIDTPDLLPERTTVKDASIELRVPLAFRDAHWSHALLGQPTQRIDDVTQTLSWHLHDQPERRIEDGTPKMDRAVRATFSTTRWRDVARSLLETMAAVDDHNPEVASWVRQATLASTSDPREAVNSIVGATGRAVRDPDATFLSDYGLGTTTTVFRTARSFYVSHEGSRSWLVLRGLRELGIPSELVVAEDEPFSGDPTFPPHRGRFSHPLVIAHLRDHDIWIDADVRGPPLPAGQISPELRGRFALHMDGTVAVLPEVSVDSELDEIDIRLELLPNRDARGTLAVELRGRNAQSLAETLERVVGAERQRALRDVVLAWLPWANVDRVELSSAEDSWRVSLRADVSIPGYALALTGRPSSSPGRATTTWILPGLDPLHWSSPRARVSSLGATFAGRAGRQSALSIGAAVQYHVHRRLQLPPGLTVAEPSGPILIHGSLIDASRTVEVAGNAIEDNFTLRIGTGTVSAVDYGAFVGEAHATDDAFLAGARVVSP